MTSFCCLLAALAVVADDQGGISVLRQGTPVISSFRLDCGTNAVFQKSYAKLKDGTKVWNRWSEDPESSGRLEIAERPDGAVEITMAGRVACKSENRTRLLELTVPASLVDGKAYSSIEANTRSYAEQHGEFTAATKALSSRFLAVDGLVFDFNALGAGTYASQRNSWHIKRQSDGSFVLAYGGEIPGWIGGGNGAKLVVREGRFEDFGRLHSLKDFRYANEFLAKFNLGFGSSARGRKWRNGNLPYNRKRSYGWTDVRGCEPVGGSAEAGVLYSAVGGSKPATYRIGGLPDGWYILTLAAGNYGGVANRFEVWANGSPFLSSQTVPAGKAKTVSRVVHSRGGEFELVFSGQWLLSSISLQAVLYDYEDFSLSGKPWRSDGYEPRSINRNDSLAKPFAPGSFVDVVDLPAPGTECAGTPRETPTPVMLPEKSPDWIRNVRIFKAFTNSALLDELDTDADLAEYFERDVKPHNANTILLSGMLSRHTFVGNIDRGVEQVKRFSDEAHRRGYRLIDHFDVTLLWNACAGFRVMCERLDELNRSVHTGLPSYQFCIMNPKFRETFFNYCERIVAYCGADGLQLDEVEFWPHGCCCRYCREAFFRDTGWHIPQNELDPAWGRGSEFQRVFKTWRIRKATDFLGAVRERLRKVRPDLVLSAYTTPYGMTSPLMPLSHGRDILDVPRSANLFGIEVMTRSVMKSARSLFSCQGISSLITRTYGTPVWNWYYNSDWQNDYVSWAIASMTGQLALLSNVERPEGTPPYPGFSALKREGADTLAEVALLFSAENRNFSGNIRYADDILGTAQALDALHIPYDFIGDEILAQNQLGKYKVLMLGSAKVFTDRQKAALGAFADRGGKVYQEMGGAPFSMGSLKVGTKFSFSPDPDAEMAFREKVRSACQGATVWSVRAPKGVRSALWREADGALVAQFLNLTGVDNKPGETVTPHAPKVAFPKLAEDVEIVLAAPRGVKAVATSPDFTGQRELEVAGEAADKVKVVIPRELLSAYVLVRLVAPHNEITR